LSDSDEASDNEAEGREEPNKQHTGETKADEDLQVDSHEMSTTPGEGPPNCAVHPSSTAAQACSHCGTFCCVLCLEPSAQGTASTLCKACVAAKRVPQGLSPWEQRAQIGWLVALWETIRQVSVAPTPFFRDLAPTERLGEAAGFAFLVAIPGSIVGSAMQFFLGGITAMLPDLGINSPFLPSGGDSGMQLISTSVQALFILFFGAPIAVFGSILSGCVHHIGLILVGGGEKGFEASVKGSLYASGVRFWSFIPMFKVVTDIWTMVLQGVAYCQLHDNPGWKGAFAVLYVACICLVGACGIGVLAAIVMGSMGDIGSWF
jgi:hypothetical protein